MRRASALLVIPLLAAATVAGCGSATSSKPPSSASSPAASAANHLVTANGAFGASPNVVVPKAAPGPDLVTKTVIQGTGNPLTTSDSLIGNFVLYDWSGTTHKLVGSTFTGNGPTLFSGQMLPGLETALIGQKVGSRVVAVLPPKYGFGTSGNSQIGIKGTDTLIYVIDLVATIANTQGASGATVSTGGGSLPTVTETAAKPAVVKVPKTAPPKTLVVHDLIKGSGPAVVKGDYTVVQYTGVIWKTNKTFDSSWSRSSPFAFNIGAGQVVKGWDQGLVGKTVGSRVMLVIPPAYGYGSAGASQAGISGTDTLVFVVDIIGTFKPTKK
jgi:FKBP-type peptidyl-prolyl cis-trans isomerase